MFSISAQKAGYSGTENKYFTDFDTVQSLYNEMTSSGEFVYVIVKRFGQVVASWINPEAHTNLKSVDAATDTAFTIMDPKTGHPITIPIINPQEDYHV